MFLDPSWSLNRVYIADLPGFDLPDQLKGKTAYDLVSSQALTRLIRQHQARLQIDADLEDYAARLAFDQCLTSDNPSIQAAAEEVAYTVGRYLGYVLLTVKRGDAVNRAARPEWGFSQWGHWAGIQRVWLGGGLVSGNLGPRLAQHAAATVRADGWKDFTIRVSLFGAFLPLVGAARHIPAGNDTGLVLDFGGTMIKRARVRLAEDQLAALHCLSSLAARWDVGHTFDDTSPAQAKQLIQRMASIIGATWREVQQMSGTWPGNTIPVSLAAYVRDGQPLSTQGGGYALTNLVTDNLEMELAGRVSAALDRRIQIKLLHDGTAAATTYGGEQNTAVIMLGTALGTGFPGDDADLRPIVPEFKISASPQSNDAIPPEPG
jgi:hypothetical protein